MKSIRWGGLITFVILFIIVIVAALFTGTVLKPVLESAFTEMNGAKVDIDKINIAYSPFTLEIDNIQITDPSEPMINTAQIEQLRLVLSFGRMLMGQLVIDDASIVGVRIDTPRKESGEIVKSASQETSEAKVEEASFDIPGFDFPDIDELLAKEPLQSEVLLDKLEKDLAEIDKQWIKTKKGLPDSEKIDSYEKRSNKIKQDAKGNTSQKLVAIKDAKVLIEELKSDVALIKQAKAQFSGDIKHVNKSIREVKSAPSKDVEHIKGKYSLNGAGAENISRMLFGDEVATYLAMARKWYARIKPYLSSDEATAEVAVERSKGVDVKFKEQDPKPEFYVRVASITADLPRGQFEGVISDISSDQSINRKPMHLKLQGVAMVGKESEVLSAEFNYVDKANSFTKINYALTKSQIEQLTISQSSQLPLDIKAALMTSKVNARLQKGVLSGVAKTQFRQVDFESGNTSMFASAFEGVKAFDIDARFSGAIGDLSIQIDSDLDSQLGRQLKAQLVQKRQQFEEDLKARIDEKISEPMARIDAKKKELDDLKQRIDDSEKQLQKKLAALKETVDKNKQQKKNIAKDKLKNKLKDKFGF
ncbi:MAG: TIGR03545 family protein [Gammaproteobacteria bacterium]